MRTELEFVASTVEGAVITNAGHWIMEEQPEQAIAVITRFVDAR
jgi:pimeloyl-ACP methyl ester carboxylesterase